LLLGEPLVTGWFARVGGADETKPAAISN